METVHTRPVPNPIERLRQARCAAAIARSKSLNDGLNALNLKNEVIQFRARALIDYSRVLMNASDELDRKIALILANCP